jgi:urease accessory protein
MRAHAALRVEAGPDNRCRLARVLDSAPIAFRQSGDEVYMVGTAAGPLATDHLSSAVDVGPGARLAMRSTAASVLYAGSGSGSSSETMVTVDADASLIWRLEPTIVTSGCRHRCFTRVWISPSAQIDWTEIVVGGRGGERPGSLHLRLDVDVDDAPLLRHGLVIGSEGPGWDGPFVLGERRVVGMRLVRTPGSDVLGDTDDRCGDGFATMRLDDHTAMVMAVGDEVEMVSDQLGQARLRWR